MANYFKPINTGGIKRFTEGATPSGWYQLNMPGAENLTLPGLAVPPNATAMLVQANTAFDYCLSPTEARSGPPQAFTLPAGGTIFISGRTSVQQFCLWLIGAGANITFQFYTGNIGPVPTID